jgi:hypothetical protein
VIQSFKVRLGSLTVWAQWIPCEPWVIQISGPLGPEEADEYLSGLSLADIASEVDAQIGNLSRFGKVGLIESVLLSLERMGEEDYADYSQE